MRGRNPASPLASWFPEIDTESPPNTWIAVHRGGDGGGASGDRFQVGLHRRTLMEAIAGTGQTARSAAARAAFDSAERVAGRPDSLLPGEAPVVLRDAQEQHRAGQDREHRDCDEDPHARNVDLHAAGTRHEPNARVT